MLKIRQARVDDAEAISALLTAAWHATYAPVYGEERIAEVTAKWHSPEAVLKDLEIEDAWFPALTDTGRIVGTAFALEEGEPGEVSLRRLYILPGETGRGYGEHFMWALFAAFPDATRFTLEVGEENEGAQRFYARHGFEIIGKTNDCGGVLADLRGILMAKEIS